MARRIPSFRTLLAFEAAARYENFSIAADELCLTPGAVSKQIQILEGFNNYGYQIPVSLIYLI